MPGSIIENFANREGADRLRSFTATWLSAGQVITTNVVPIGGLRISAYLALHVNPIASLGSLEERLNADVTISSLDGSLDLLAPDTVTFADDQGLRRVELDLFDADSVRIATAVVVQDVSDLSQSLLNALYTSLLIFFVIALPGAGFSVFAVVRHVNRLQQQAVVSHAAQVEQAAEIVQMHEERQEVERVAAENRVAALRTMANTIDGAVTQSLENVEKAIGDLLGYSERLDASSDTVSGQSSQVSLLSNSALNNVQAVAAASEELTTTMGTVEHQIGEATEIATSAVTEAKNTGEVVTRLNQGAEQIGQVVQLITDIATKTNLLALNATIESARAGEAGRGFAVVANEVKALAGQTTGATSKITEQVSEIQSVAQQMVQAIGSIGETIGRIDEITRDVADAIHQQRDATGETTTGIHRSAEASHEVTKLIGGVKDEAEVTKEISGTARTASKLMAQEIRDLGQSIRRAIRTSTDETNRRREERYATDFTVDVVAQDKNTRARLANVSRNGACLKGLPPMVIGDGLRIHLPAHERPVAGRIVGTSKDAAHIAFDSSQEVDLSRFGFSPSDA